MKNLIGVTGVLNNITIKPDCHDKVEKKEVERALANSLKLDGRYVSFFVSLA